MGDNFEWVGMAEAAALLSVASAAVARRLVLAKDSGVRVERPSARVLLALRSDVLALAERRGGRVGPGRPRGRAVSDGGGAVVAA